MGKIGKVKSRKKLRDLSWEKWERGRDREREREREGEREGKKEREHLSSSSLQSRGHCEAQRWNSDF